MALLTAAMVLQARLREEVRLVGAGPRPLDSSSAGRGPRPLPHERRYAYRAGVCEAAVGDGAAVDALVTTGYFAQAVNPTSNAITINIRIVDFSMGQSSSFCLRPVTRLQSTGGARPVNP